MRYEAHFLGYYEKRLRLQLLRSELLRLRQRAVESRIADPAKVETEYSLVTFDITVIEAVLADTYPLTASSRALYDVLAELRHEVMIANNKITIFFSIVATPITGKQQLVREHNEWMAAKCIGIESLCTNAIATLDQILV